MDKRDGVPNRSYPPEFRVEALRLAQSVGVTEAAKRLGIPQSSLGNWMRSSRRGEVTATTKAKPGGTATEKSELEAENARLRQELANAKLDLEIVKKAAVYFAKESR